MGSLSEEEFDRLLNEAILFEERIDPPERPFDSKYTAIQLLVRQ